MAVGEATVKFKSVKFKCDLRVRVRAYYIYGTTAKFKSANIFIQVISAARGQTANLDHQYFRVYNRYHVPQKRGICTCGLRRRPAGNAVCSRTFSSRCAPEQKTLANWFCLSAAVCLYLVRRTEGFSEHTLTVTQLHKP